MSEPVSRSTIADRFDPRRNSVNALRLALAATVLISHGVKFAGFEDPLRMVTGGQVDFGTMAVDGFFILSGFLIVRSFMNSPSVWRYMWHRALRILPGFWICLLISAMVLLPLAQLLEYHTFTGFPLTGDDSVIGYVANNLALYMNQFHVRGLMAGEAVDGSLYTLFYEFMCYLGVAVLGVLGLYYRNRWAIVATVALVWTAILIDLITGGAITNGSTMVALTLRLGGMFLAGMVFQLWADRIPLTGRGGLLAAAVLAMGFAGANWQGSDPGSWLTYMLLAPPALGYLLLLAGASTRVAAVGSRRDISYGLYIYAWPIQVLLLLVGAGTWFLPFYLAVSVVLAVAAAYVSWILVESPALSMKSWAPRSPTRVRRMRSRDGTATGPEAELAPVARPASPDER